MGQGDHAAPWVVRTVPNAEVYLPQHRRELPLVLFGTHIDTVSRSTEDRYPPGTLQGGRLYGRGTLDMHSGLATCLWLLRHGPVPPDFDIGLIVTTDEEGDSSGAWGLVRERWFHPDLIIVPEPTWEHVALSASGRRAWEVSFHSGGGHAEGDLDRKPNPVEALLTFFSGVPASLSVTELHTTGGGGVSLPTGARARFEQVFRTRVVQRRGDAWLHRRLRTARGRFPGVQSSLALVPRSTPWPDPYRANRTPLVRRWLDATARGGVGRTLLMHEHAVGDFNAYARVAPTIIYGPGGGGVHGTDEYVDLRSLEQCFGTYRRFLECPGSKRRTQGH
jgi:acetylornithine deacetylase